MKEVRSIIKWENRKRKKK